MKCALVVAGFGLWALLPLGRARAPRARGALVGLTVALPFLTAGAFVFDIFQGVARGEAPYWADSVGIPLMGVPVQVGVLLAWSLAHLGLARPGVLDAPLARAFSRRANGWLLLVSALTAVLLVLFLALGAYWNAVPGALWLYFYLSLAAGRRVAGES